jgi:hypothetical protein
MHIFTYVCEQLYEGPYFRMKIFVYVCLYVYVGLYAYRISENSGSNGNFIYCLHYMLYMFTPTEYAFSRPLCHVCADFAQHIGMDSSTTFCNSLPKVTKISDFTAYTCAFRIPKMQSLHPFIQCERHI